MSHCAEQEQSQSLETAILCEKQNRCFASAKHYPNAHPNQQETPRKIRETVEFSWRQNLHIFRYFRMIPGCLRPFGNGIQEVSGSILLIFIKLQPKGWSLLFLKLCGESVRSGHPGRGVPTVYQKSVILSAGRSPKSKDLRTEWLFSRR